LTGNWRRTLKKIAGSPRTDLPSAITFLLDKHEHPSWYRADVLPWEQLIADPNWRTAKQLLGVDPDMVSRIVERLVADEPSLGTNRKARMCLGKVRQYRGDHEAAMAVFRAMDEWDLVIPALYNVGLCHLALKNVDLARAAFQQVLSKDPNDWRAQKALEELPS